MADIPMPNSQNVFFHVFFPKFSSTIDTGIHIRNKNINVKNKLCVGLVYNDGLLTPLCLRKIIFLGTLA